MLNSLALPPSSSGVRILHRSSSPLPPQTFLLSWVISAFLFNMVVVLLWILSGFMIKTPAFPVNLSRSTCLGRLLQKESVNAAIAPIFPA